MAISPLKLMTAEERLIADFESTGVTLGPHPMAYHRAEMNAAGVLTATSLRGMTDGMYTCIAGAVIARQRPGTAEGFIFLSLEDETGIPNAIINPHLYERNRVTVTREKFLRIEGTLQNQDGIINVRASAVHVLKLSDVNVRSRCITAVNILLHTQFVYIFNMKCSSRFLYTSDIYGELHGIQSPPSRGPAHPIFVSYDN